MRKVESNPPEEVERVVDGLARVTASLLRTLQVAEPGKFVLTGHLEDKELSDELDVLREANQTGYLRILKDEESRIIFRVHTPWPPSTTSPIAAATTTCSLLRTDLTNLRTARDDSVASKVVGDIVQRYSPPASATL